MVLICYHGTQNQSSIINCIFTNVAGVCLSTDVDTLLYHMNNARYLRELDFARVDFYERTRLYRTIRAKGGAVVQGACTIRYRRFVRPFSRYTITSKVRVSRNNYLSLQYTADLLNPFPSRQQTHVQTTPPPPQQPNTGPRVTVSPFPLDIPTPLK